MLDFRERLSMHGIRFRVSGSDKAELSINCLFCIKRGYTRDTKRRLGINIKTGEAHCFNCGFKRKKGALKIILAALGDGEGVVGYEETEDEPKQIPRLPSEFCFLSGCRRRDLYLLALEYLEQRSISDHQIYEKRLGVCLSGKYAHRIIFPFYEKEKLVGFTARGFTNQSQIPKYLHSPGLSHPYNIPTKKRDRAVLSEGVMDALAIERAYSGADSVALLGHALPDTKLALLLPYKGFILYADPDPTGLIGMALVGERLALLGKSVWAAGVGESDAGSTDEKTIAENIYNAREFNMGVSQLMRLKASAL
jgi:hypothetical protein